MRIHSYILIFWMVALLGGIAFRHGAEPSPDELLRRAQRYLVGQRNAEAEQSLRRFLAREPDRTEPRLWLSKLAVERRDWATVAAVLRPIPDTERMAAGVRVAEGDAWYNLHRAARADDCWSRALKLDPENKEARNRLISLCAIQLRRASWRSLLWELYDRDQAGIDEMIQLMVSDHSYWDLNQALGMLRVYVASDPDDAASRRALATYMLRAGRVQDAEHLLATLWQREPQELETWSILTECQLVNADISRSRDLLAQAPHNAPEDFRYWKLQGTFALLENRFADAVANFRQALVQAPYDLELRQKLSQALRSNGDPDSSQRHSTIAAMLAKIERLCHTLHNKQPWDVDEVRQMVDLCEQLRLIEEGRGWIRVGLSRDPEDTYLLAAHSRLAELPVTSARRPPPWENLR